MFFPQSFLGNWILTYVWWHMLIISVHRILKHNACFPIHSHMFPIFDSTARGKWHFGVFKICFSVIVWEWQALTLVKWTNSCLPGSVWHIWASRETWEIYFGFFFPSPTHNMLMMYTHSRVDLIQGKRGIVPVCWFQGLSSIQNKQWS